MLGLAGAILAGLRHGAATPGLALVFAGVALRQGLLLHGGVVSEAPIADAGELAILCGVTGALLALRSLRRTTRERDRAEDLHWDSMEAVRAISEHAARPPDLPGKLTTVLELGAARFDLAVGLAWREDGGPDGELLALRAPAAGADPGDAWRTELLPRLRESARATRPVVLPGDGDHPVLFAGPFAAGGARGAIAFAGSRRQGDRFTATDKDLLGLMAVWLAGEIERRTPAEAPAPSPEAPSVAQAPRRLPLRQDRDRDLNHAVRRAERGLRRRVGADATLEVALADDLPPVAAGRLPLATLVESVVLAAARLAPAGRIRVETSQLADAGPGSPVRGGDVMLSASVEGDVDAAALERIFAQPDADEPGGGALSLARLERLLRRDGADLSVAVEPGRRALLTAYLAAADPATDRPSTARERSRAATAGADQPSR